MSYAVAALVDIDDFIASSQAQGQVWARRQLRRADRAVHAAAFGRPGVTCRPQPPEEWLVMLTGADPEALMSEATALAEEVRARIVRETAWTATVSLGVPRLGHEEAQREAEREARLANDYKLVLGGDRVISSEASAARGALSPPVRIEEELTRRVRAGDRNGAAGLLAGWVDRCASERDVDPGTLRNWLIGELLFVVDVVNRSRLPDGSTDWVEACARLPIEDIVTVGDIHERSYLHIWLRETLGRLMPPPRAHRHPGAGGDVSGRALHRSGASAVDRGRGGVREPVLHLAPVRRGAADDLPAAPHRAAAAPRPPAAHHHGAARGRDRRAHRIPQREGAARRVQAARRLLPHRVPQGGAAALTATTSPHLIRTTSSGPREARWTWRSTAGRPACAWRSARAAASRRSGGRPACRTPRAPRRRPCWSGSAPDGGGSARSAWA
ncbi:hypothetical protein [Nonomuraea dietziae]|uniref:hypothetical protein n=1 Tax=Nonomuraea dietziae TaxID=65515 RepID=UPI0031E3E823